MKRLIHVHLVPELVSIQSLAGQTVIVVDVLRATTTLACALGSGAERILPCLEVAEARELARGRGLAGERALLGGERGGKPIAGFDLGNSPLEYTPERVGGQSLVFTTTNGTRAMMRCVGATRVLLGSFVNLAAVLESLEQIDEAHILCAGTDGEPSWEDTLLAGAMVADWCRRGEVGMNDAARMARRMWESAGGYEGKASDWLPASLRLGSGGRNLLDIGREADIDFSARIDAVPVVPELVLSDWWIRRVE